MENPGFDLGAACLALEEIIEAQKERLNSASEEISSLDPSVKASRAEIVNGKTPAALEALKHNLAALQGFLNTLGSNFNVYPEGDGIVASKAKMWLEEKSVELQETLLEEKSKQQTLRDQIRRRNLQLEENFKLLQVLEKEKEGLENKQEELEAQKVADLEEKLANVKRLYAEMREHLKSTVDTFFPDPKVPGFKTMYNLLTELTAKLQSRERDTYVEVTDAVWQYYVNTLERHGIIERHPTDKSKIRIIDFSDGRLGS